MSPGLFSYLLHDTIDAPARIHYKSFCPLLLCSIGKQEEWILCICVHVIIAVWNWRELIHARLQISLNYFPRTPSPFLAHSRGPWI